MGLMIGAKRAPGAWCCICAVDLTGEATVCDDCAPLIAAAAQRVANLGRDAP